MANDNKSIGRFQLTDIPPAQRGTPQIEVTFDIDANGIMKVSAKDKATGKEQHINIESSSGLTDEEIQKMRDEAKANEDADKEVKEKVDKLNAADQMIFQTEKQIAEFGDKLPADKKEPIEAAIAELKKAHEAEDIAAIDTSMEALNQIFQAASQEMYAQSNEAGAEGQAPEAEPAKEDVTDVDFEEVK
jgi:molecular chaperone DnaK